MTPGQSRGEGVGSLFPPSLPSGIGCNKSRSGNECEGGARACYKYGAMKFGMVRMGSGVVARGPLVETIFPSASLMLM